MALLLTLPITPYLSYYKVVSVSTYYFHQRNDMSDNPTIQESIDAVSNPLPASQGDVPQGEGPIDPNGPPMAPPTGTPGVSNPNPVPVPSALQQQQVQQAQQQQAVTRHALFGAAVKSMVHSLEGTRTSYQVNPQTGATEETTVPNKPGQLFRNLLAGALIGGAAGGEGTGATGFLGGLARGGTASMQNRQQQDAQQREAAQQQFQNQMKAQQNQREQDAFKTEQDVRKA